MKLDAAVIANHVVAAGEAVMNGVVRTALRAFELGVLRRFAVVLVFVVMPWAHEC